MVDVAAANCLKKNLEASRPSEHLPVRGVVSHPAYCLATRKLLFTRWWPIVAAARCLKKNLKASRPSKHRPVRGVPSHSAYCLATRKLLFTRWWPIPLVV